MSRLFRFVRLPANDRKILMKTVLLLWAVRLGLWILPFQRLRHLLSKRTIRLQSASHLEWARVEKITRYVRLMSRYPRINVKKINWINWIKLSH